MRLIRGALKGAVAAKAIQIVRREAAKPENQRRAKELLASLRNRSGPAGRSAS
ncbi:hypothetical protein ATJ97_3461 [Georgenia soli]|uniref:Uncharacterized protein n=1 Tax=Georgenia soli TaxID=638953 RepID=A0A2A9ERU2_9MICO|nr:hypothetical protein [Georgenia soli]PFG40919.1 hypothetical protein ATJ97_3461 [Georgenia soli]